MMDLCERYWASPWETISADTGEDGLQAQYDRARRDLLLRPAECVAWALGLSAVDESQPRSLGIELLAQAVYGECLGAYEDSALHAFIEVLERPLRSRWDQIALDTAIGALGALGYSSAVPALTRILQSEDREYQGDTHWNIAAALERISGQSFLHKPDPVEAARLWALQSS
ncbi:hypothetical protein CCAX7_19770 [Capsulimonas corticalis]|uniref:Uncharacterized protein n=1 Tax=Capsulimonas corticalis TaxID=2219043 RepID=A0A402D2Q8_9BACT|nr:hypothetical protein [Capsulimonas corticalis]BDI29926.1 hypothetical protein CCAX7_19770 [Capsulimonas corticalis]